MDDNLHRKKLFGNALQDRDAVKNCVLDTPY